MSAAPIVLGLPVLSRIARATLGWNQKETAERAGLPKTTLARFETVTGDLTSAQCASLLETYSVSGVDFAAVDGSIRITIDGETIATALEELEDPERRRLDYKGSR